MAAQDTLSLTVDGTIYKGWTSVSVTRSIEQAAAGFSIEVADKWQHDHLRWPIKPGDCCTVSLGDDVVIRGHVDDANPGIDAGSHRLSITGRCMVGDLVDCSAINTPDEWTGLTLEAVAQRLAAPFGIKVRALADTGEAFTPFKLQQGETAWEAIERMCRARAVLGVSDGRGGLLIIRAGQGRAGTNLVEGENILAAGARYSSKDRYSDYIVKGQQACSAGVDGVDAEAARSPRGGAKDAHVTRYRPLLVLADSQATGHTPTARARWEATVRAGKSTRLNVTVQGWRMANGKLWPLNTRSRVVSPMLDIDETMLITAVVYTLDDQGTRTELTLQHPDAFTVLPEVPRGDPATGTGVSGAGNTDHPRRLS